MSAYLRAIEQGADSIEPDLVMTKDGVLICRHENQLSHTTNVSAHPEFAERRVEKTVDDVTALGWWAEDFTLAEIKTLRARERLPQWRPASAAFDDQEPIVTFAELLALAQKHGRRLHPELKHVAYLKSIGLDPVPALVDLVRRSGGQSVADIMSIECFEVGVLQELAGMASLRWLCVQLLLGSGKPPDRPDMSYVQMATDAGLRAISDYAAGVSVEKAMLIPRDSQNRSLPPTDLVARAHALGLEVLSWTFRPENFFLAVELRSGDPSASDYLRQHGDFAAELHQFEALGVDGVFCDFPGLAVAARH
jgi:glycerophosphoryl diester phosphodiesterase